MVPSTPALDPVAPEITFSSSLNPLPLSVGKLESNPAVVPTIALTAVLLVPSYVS
jgi:hypothetical protein